MEVDSTDTWSVNHDSNKFGNLKEFVAAAREFEATHSDHSINLMTRCLGTIASTCDLSIFSPGRAEVCAFFSSLWRVMCNNRAPHWAGVAVLGRAAMESSARYALMNTYKFMPILTKLLNETGSLDKKMKLLSVMQEITYGIKIPWQESYLSTLMKQLTDLIVQPMIEHQQRLVAQMSLTVLVNICYGNLPAVHALTRTVDTKQFVVHLISLKDGGNVGVEVCRLLLCLSSSTGGSVSVRASDIHSYLTCTLRTFKKAIQDRDSTQLLHAYTFINDLCSDSNLRPYVATYQHFSTVLQDAIRETGSLCKTVPGDTFEPETSRTCVHHIIKFINVVVNLDLLSLKSQHSAIVSLCMKAACVSLPEALELFSTVISLYKEEGRLPQELVSVMSDGLPGLLVPPTIDTNKAGLQWLQAVSSLCDISETRERVLLEITPDGFEDTLYTVLQYCVQNGPLGVEIGQQAALLGTRIALSLTPHSQEWDGAMHRMLAQQQIRKMLCSALCGNVARRKQTLLLVKHHCFPSDIIHQVFADTKCDLSMDSGLSTSRSFENNESETMYAISNITPTQEDSIKRLVERLDYAFKNNQISDITTTSIIELYGHKMNCLEQRIHSQDMALQSATDQLSTLQHTIAMYQATSITQQDVLLTSQVHNEKHKQTIITLHKQLEEAECKLQASRAKIAAERMDKENQRELLEKEFRSRQEILENDMKAREQQMQQRMREIETEYKAMQKKLEEQTTKNTELAGVLTKFEERVKARDKRLEEAKKDLTTKETTIKQLEKTVVERENRLYQVTSQLEEMKRVQEMVASLMSKTTSNTSTKN